MTVVRRDFERTNRRQALKKVGVIAAGAVVPACSRPQMFGGSGTNDRKSQPPTASENVRTSAGDRQAADFTLEAYQGADVLGASVVRFSRVLHAGRPVVLNFWAGQCAPCRFEMPDLQQIYEATRQSALFVGVDIGPFVGLGSIEEGRALVSELGVTYPVGTTREPDVVRQYLVLGMPTTVFITPSAEIVRHWTGVLSAAATRELVDELVDVSRAGGSE